MRDKLFLLKPDFADGDSLRYYCVECAQLEGVLSLYPGLRTELDVERVDFQRPRKALLELIGEPNQSAPVLIVGNASSRPDGIQYGEHENRHFVSGADAISRYLAKQYNIGSPH